MINTVPMIKMFAILVVILELTTASIHKVQEKSEPGTVVISNLSQVLASSKNIYVSNPMKNMIIKITNVQDPGVLWFSIDKENDTLVLDRKPDRDLLCNTNKPKPINYLQTEMNKISLLYSDSSDQNHGSCLVKLSLLFGSLSDPSLVTIIVDIIDVNDNNPIFPKNELIIRMKEHSMLEVNTPAELEAFKIDLPLAVDKDILQNDIQSYYIEGQDAAYFKLNAEIIKSSDNEIHLKLFLCGVKIPSSGEACTRNAQLFDRETREEFSLNLIAVDGGLSMKTAKLKVRIVLEDINDMRPTFSQPNYEGKLNENDPQGTLIAKISAFDNDCDFQNNKINFRIPGSFTSSKRSLSKSQMVAAKFFDIEQEKKSTSGSFGSRNNLTMANLIVKPGSAESRMKAMNDLMAAAKKDSEEYSIFQSNSNFKKLDFFIEAFDYGEPVLVSKVTVSLIIIDVNNMKPEIFINYINPLVINKASLHPLSYGTVLENQARSMLAQITVKDQDTFVSENDLNCNLSDNRFTLEEIYEHQRSVFTDKLSDEANEKNFKLMSITKLDREANGYKADSFKFTITCVDNVKGALPGGQLTSVQEIRVIIDDENDNYPKFEKASYQFRVDENEPNIEENPHTMRHFVGTVHAVDVDEGKNAIVEYELLTNPYEAFEIDKTNGSIFIIRPFDREQIDKISLKVHAFDRVYNERFGKEFTNHLSNDISSICDVDIFIEDTNDCAPRFRENTYYFEIEENSPDFDIGYLIATDEDVSSNQTKISYHLGFPANKQNTYDSHDGSMSEDVVQIFSHFKLDRNTGQLKLKQKLDRETRSVYEFVVYASDGAPSMKGKQLTGSTSVIITVLDVNDNQPVIISPKHQEELFWDRSITAGNTIFSIIAEDKDLGENATLRYYLRNEQFEMPNEENQNNTNSALRPVHGLPIACDENSGNFYFSKTLTIDTSLPFTYSLNVLIEDMGSAVKLNTSITIYVTIGGRGEDLMYPQQAEAEYNSNWKVNTKIVLLILTSAFILLLVLLVFLIGYKKIFIKHSISPIGPDGLKLPTYQTNNVHKTNSVALNNMIKNHYLDEYNNQYVHQNSSVINLSGMNVSPKMTSSNPHAQTIYRLNSNDSNSSNRPRKTYYFPINPQYSASQHNYMQSINKTSETYARSSPCDKLETEPHHEANGYMTMRKCADNNAPYTDVRVLGKVKSAKYETLANHKNLKMVPFNGAEASPKQPQTHAILRQPSHQMKEDQLFILDNNLSLLTIKNNNAEFMPRETSEMSRETSLSNSSHKNERTSSGSRQSTQQNNTESSFV